MTTQGGLSMTEQLGSERGAAFKWRWALPLLPIAVSMFCLSALVYYHTAMGGTGAAWGFFQGAVVFTYRWLGFVPTFMFWLLLFVWCSIWFVTGRWDSVRTRLMWLGAFTLCIAILVNLGTPVDPPPHAGLIGTYIAVRLTSVIGYAFGALLAVAASLASLLLATDFLFYRYFETLARGRATEETGVESEATDAFRELAFSGVYAEQPRPAVASVEPETADAAMVRVLAEAEADDALAGDLARAVEQDVVVRPRRRRRHEVESADETHADSAEPVRHAATVESEFGIVVPDEVPETEVPAEVCKEAAFELLVPAAAQDNFMPSQDVPVAALDEATVGEPATDAVDTDDAIDADPDQGSALPREPMVEIPRNPARRQRTLFTPPAAPSADVDRAAREVLAAGRASLTLLRRHLRCSASEAIAMLDSLRSVGVIDGEPGSANGRVLTTLADWEAR